MASTAPTQQTINSTVGAMLIGVMVQQSLFGYIFAQGCSCYKFKDRDSQLYRYLVAGLLAFSTLEAAMDMHVIYRSNRYLHLYDFSKLYGNSACRSWRR
ncbi:hypothetical protein B0H13DRAFT_2350717 [Mycena leptocephala]|nr:hypothetical protein B0H13DRAFT_2350717 [Mycena leptocephala]